MAVLVFLAAAAGAGIVATHLGLLPGQGLGPGGFGPAGRRIIDFRESNLHVVSYSVPVSAVMPWQELKGHLFTLPEHPNWRFAWGAAA